MWFDMSCSQHDPAAIQLALSARYKCTQFIHHKPRQLVAAGTAMFVESEPLHELAAKLDVGIRPATVVHAVCQ